MTRHFKTTTLIALLCIGSLFSACKKDGDSPNNTGSAHMSLRLTDGPGDYDALYIDIQQVQIITEGGTTTVIPARPGIYNLLALSNGIDTLLLNADIAPGTVSQIRLVLGPNNSIVVNNQSYPLSTPSAQESGLKLNIHETLTAGASYTFWLDFDVAKSILQTGNGQYKLKPVIRAYTALTDGRIKGYVLPLAALTTVYAVNGTDTFGAIPNSNGFFQIQGLPSGTYTVIYDANAGTYVDVVLPNIQVNYGLTADLGTRVMIP